MPIYHTLGQIPRKRHIAFRKPDGGLYAEELMGHEGFTGTSSLLYHVHPPTTVKSARRLRETKYEADPDQTLRHRHFRTSQVKKGGSPTLDRIPLLFNQDIAMLYVEPDENDAHFYRNAQADELVYVSKGSGHARDACSATCPTARATTSSSTAASCTAGGSTWAASRPSSWSWRAGATCAGPSATATSSASSSRARPTASATSAGRPQLRTHDEKGDFPILVKQYDGLNEIILDHHPVRRGRLGRLLLSLGLQHQRLRADRRPGAPAAAGAPDVSGRRVRGLQLLPPAVRLPSRGGAGAVQPQQRGLGRGALLRLQRVHEPEGDRVRQHHPPSRTASRTGRIRAAPRRASGPSTPTSWR